MEQTQRALQRAFCVAALPEGDDLAELGELLRTAGVAVVGEMVQRREQPHPNTYLGPGKVAEAKAAANACEANLIACDDELTARQERNLEEAIGPARGGSHDGDPRHLRLPREQRRRQAAGRAGPARVQPRADAGAVDPPGAARAAGSARGGPERHRSRPTAAWRATASPRCAADSSTSRERERFSAPSASGRRCPRSRLSATQTPASRRC